MGPWADRLRVDADPPGAVCCLPDLFLDHLVPLGPAEAALDDLADVARRGGGNRHTGPQALQVGGNAANLARGLARLGVDASLVAPTDGVGASMARDELAPLGVDVGGVRDVGQAAHTAALEFGAEAGAASGANVMLSDPGPLEGLGPEDLREGDRAQVREADVVAVTNWAKTRPGGTALLEEVARLADEAGADVYVDTSDPAPRPREEVEALLASPALDGGVAAWGMNEHEARVLAGAAGADDPTVEEAADVLAERTGARVDVHTAEAAWTRGGADAATAPAFDVDPRRLTGAGDAWNAGNILAGLLGLPDRDRLRVAHAVAALAIRDPEGPGPDRGAVAGFLEERGGGSG